MDIKRLPKGYYAVQTDFENAAKNSFTYKGVTYAVTEGENLFPNLNEAGKLALETPDEKIEGIESLEEKTPVILFSEGRHVIDGFSFNRSLMLLGQGAGIDPNVPDADDDAIPTLNPARAEGESELYGSFWHGVMKVGNPDAATIVLDGFSINGARLTDLRREGTYALRFYNLIHVSHDGHTLYQFSSPKAGELLQRDVTFRGVRIVDYDDCEYGAPVLNLHAHKLTLERVCCACSNKTFGFGCFTGAQKEGERSVYRMKDCFFKDVSGYGGIKLACGQGAADIVVSDSVFLDASLENDAVLQPELSEECRLTVSGCRFADTRGNQSSAVRVNEAAAEPVVENCTVEGFVASASKKIVPTVAPDRITDPEQGYRTETEDSHRVIGSTERDLSLLDRLYEGRTVYRGDLHVHTNCGGTSDGTQPMNEWPAKMDALGVDFAAVVDHRQMRGFFLPEWDEERFIIGTEPGAHLKGLNACRHGMAEIHYNMLFPHKYGLAMVLANFPEFQFHGDELTGSFRYFTADKTRYMELFDYVKSIGGIVVHAHPKSMLVSSDPMDYYYGEHTYIETIYDSVYSPATRNNYKLWCDLLAMGKRVYASGGSDSHSDTKNNALSSFYTKEKSGLVFFNKMHEADFNVGAIGIKMGIECEGEIYPMGSEIEYREGMKLSLRIEDFFAPEWRADTVYVLRVFTDRGLAYSAEFNGKLSQELQMEVQKRAFYRVDIYDKTHECVVAVGNPIWMD